MAGICVVQNQTTMWWGEAAETRILLLYSWNGLMGRVAKLDQLETSLCSCSAGWERDLGPVISASNLNQVFYHDLKSGVLQGEWLHIILGVWWWSVPCQGWSHTKGWREEIFEDGFQNRHQSSFSHDSRVSLNTLPLFYTLEARKSI